jgi:hypothetical protein
MDYPRSAYAAAVLRLETPDGVMWVNCPYASRAANSWCKENVGQLLK